MSGIWEPLVRCPHCREQAWDARVDEVDCRTCGATYPVDDGVPLIVAETDALFRAVRQRGERRQPWFENDQLDVYDAGPYRHATRRRTAYYRQLLGPYLTESSAVLDFGCGDGANLRELMHLPHRALVGVDYNLVRLQRAKRLMGPSEAVLLADLFEQTLQPGSFDVIFCNHVLEHIERDVEALTRLFEALSDGGVLLLGVPNEGSLTCKLREYVLQPYLRFYSDHIHRYTASRLRKKVCAAGFEVVEEHPIGFVLPCTVIDKQLKRSARACRVLSDWVETRFPSQCDALYFLCRKPATKRMPAEPPRELVETR